MKTNNIIKGFLFGLMAVGLFTGCVEDDDFGIPNLDCNDPGLTATKTVQDIFDVSTQNATQYTDDDVIEGYVVSSDEGGNFFKNVSIQTLDGSLGFSVAIDVTDLYTEFEPGRKVYIKLKDRYTAVDFDALEIGDLFGGNQVGRLPETIYRDVVIRSCDFIQEDNIVNRIGVNEISDQYLNTLVEFTDVQFLDDAIGTTYYDESNDLGGSTNHLLSDTVGFEVIFRTSSFADFASFPVAEGRGTVRGILTKFGNDYQLLARTIDDVQIEGARQPLERIGIGALRLKEQDTPLNDSRFVEGIVILSGNNDDNITGRNVVVQDETGGIVFRFDSDGQGLMEGDMVRLAIDGYNLDTFAGLVQLENIDFDDVEILSQNNALPGPAVVTISDVLSGDYESQYVQIDGVQFLDDEQGDNYSGTQNITDCNNTLAMFTRSAASFSGDTVATGNGPILGVASTFNAPQLLLRNLDGVAGMTGARCQEPVAFFEEEFNSGIPATWETVATTGTALWNPNDFGGVFYAQMSAFAGGGNPILDVVTWLVTPEIDFDAQGNEALRIKMADAFQNGNPLKIFYSTDYTGNGDPNSATWTQIGADETAGLINNGGFFDNVYEDSDPIDLSTVTGTGYVAFVYDSNGGTISTTLQLDRVEITGN